MSTPNAGPGPTAAGPRWLVPGAVAVIAAGVVSLFAIGGGGSDARELQAGDCLPADGDTAVSCTDDDATYRVIDTRSGVREADAQAACADVAGVAFYGWRGESGEDGTAYCLGPI